MTKTDEHARIDIAIGARIRERRVSLGMSQSKLAGAIDLTFQQVQKYERGANSLSVARLLQIAEALNSPVSFFLQESPDAETTEDDDASDRERLNLMADYRRLPPQMRDVARRSVRTLVEAWEVPRPTAVAA